MELAVITELSKGRYTGEEVLRELISDLTYLKDKASELSGESDAAAAFNAFAVLKESIAGYTKELWLLKSMPA